MKNLLKRLKVGQKVWSLSFGKGKVVELGRCEDFPIKVKFASGKDRLSFTDSFTAEGLHYKERKTPDIWLKKPVIIQKSRIQSIAAESYGQGLIDGEHLERMLPLSKPYNYCSDTPSDLKFEKCSFIPPINFK